MLHFFSLQALYDLSECVGSRLKIWRNIHWCVWRNPIHIANPKAVFEFIELGNALMSA